MITPATGAEPKLNIYQIGFDRNLKLSLIKLINGIMVFKNESFI